MTEDVLVLTIVVRDFHTRRHDSFAIRLSVASDDEQVEAELATESDDFDERQLGIRSP